MTDPRRLLLGVAALLFAVTAGVSCYNPHVESGHLRCAPTLPQCPDGFSCEGGLCVTSTGSGKGGAPGTGGAGGGAGGSGGSTCANPVAPLCTPAQASGNCDPVCQTGCGCGQRCVVAAGGPKCVATTGALTAGMVCKPEADACAPGLVCLQEACGNDLGRCYRFCDTSNPSMCAGTGVCGTPVLLPDRTDSGQYVCDLAVSCDPYAGTGCADPALQCFVLGPTQQTCDCPSGANGQVGATCTTTDCAPGLACLGIGAGAAARCVKLCQSAAECPGSTCDSFAATFGYCALTN